MTDWPASRNSSARRRSDVPFVPEARSRAAVAQCGGQVSGGAVTRTAELRRRCAPASPAPAGFGGAAPDHNSASRVRFRPPLQRTFGVPPCGFFLRPTGVDSTYSRPVLAARGKLRADLPERQGPTAGGSRKLRLFRPPRFALGQGERARGARHRPRSRRRGRQCRPRPESRATEKPCRNSRCPTTTTSRVASRSSPEARAASAPRQSSGCVRAEPRCMSSTWLRATTFATRPAEQGDRAATASRRARLLCGRGRQLPPHRGRERRGVGARPAMGRSRSRCGQPRQARRSTASAGSTRSRSANVRWSARSSPGSIPVRPQNACSSRVTPSRTTSSPSSRRSGFTAAASCSPASARRATESDVGPLRKASARNALRSGRCPACGSSTCV